MSDPLARQAIEQLHVDLSDAARPIVTLFRCEAEHLLALVDDLNAENQRLRDEVNMLLNEAELVDPEREVSDE